MEKVIEVKSCRFCSVSFKITDIDSQFYEKVSPTFGGKKYLIPTPNLCPDCRQQRRASFRNERNLYRRNCDATGQEIVSIYSPDKKVPVYRREYWLGDKWNPFDYGRDISFSHSIFEQFSDLLHSVPRPALHQEGKNENSEFTNEVDGHKNCYLTFDGSFNEGVLYCNWIGNSKDSVDCSYSFGIENCYQCFNCYDSFQLYYSLNCQKCTNSWYLSECEGCNFCIGCVGLHNVNYHIENIPVTKEKYEEELIKIQKQERKGIEILEKSLQFPRKAHIVRNSEHTVGNNITDSSNIFFGFDVFKCKDCKYIYDIGDSKNVMDFYEGWLHPEFCYEGETSGGSYHCAFTQRCIQCKYTYYSSFSFSCEYCFLCVGLTHEKYCILNKQYTKGEYEILVPKIIEHMMKNGEWGEFFPSNLSLFGYNESMAQEYFPLTREEVLNPQSLRDSSFIKGAPKNLLYVKEDARKAGGFVHGKTFNWSDYEAPFPKVEKIIPASKLPNDITKIPDDILNWAILPDEVVETHRNVSLQQKPFRIIKQELEFYRKHNLPIPKKHPDQRHLERMQLRNPRKLFTRHCDKCKKEIQTTYAPERPEIVYCDECYKREVYGRN